MHGLLRALRGETDLRLTLCAPAGSPLAERAAALGIEVMTLPLRGEWDIFSSRAMRRWITEHGVHLVHTHDAHAHALALRAVRPLSSVKLVVHRRVDFPIARGWLGRRKYGPRVDRFIAISTGVADVLARGGVPRERIAVIPSGVAPAKFEGLAPAPAFRRDLGIADDAPVIGAVGALVDHKGHRYLIDAMPAVLAERPDAHCVIVGEGPLRNDLTRQIGKRDLAAHVHLLGWRDDIAPCLDEFTVLCLPSPLEGLCTSLLDATLRHRPLIACDTGGVPDIVRDGETGWLVAPRDPAALATALLDALGRPAEAHHRAEAARHQTVKRFSLLATAEKTLALWRRLVAEDDAP